MEKNKLAYKGLKKLGHNITNNKYNNSIDYKLIWNREKHNPDLFDEWTVNELIEFKVPEFKY